MHKRLNKQNMYTVYILRTSANTLYTGQTNNLTKRLEQHKNKTKKSSKYMRSFPSFDLVYTEIYVTKTEALQREYQIKQLKKEQKEALIRGSKAS